MIGILAFALCFASLSSASFLDNTLLNPPNDADYLECLKANQEQVSDCVLDVNHKIANHQTDIDNHKDDPENVTDETKKDVCCAEWTSMDCIMEAVKPTPGCTEVVKKVLDNVVQKLSKICGTKFSRGGEGCKKTSYFN